MTTLKCQGLRRRFANTDAVDNVDLTVEAGSVLAIVGPSGCGKTTLLRMIAGFESLDSGRIEIGGVVVADKEVQVPPERRRVGLVFQDYALFPHLSAFDNIAFGLRLRDKQQRQERIEQLLQLVGLTEHRHRMPHQLSGGEQQRVALARALAAEPQVLLLDEPLSNLDADLRLHLRGQLRQILQQTGLTSILVTHDQDEAFYLGAQIAVMNRGRIEQQGSAYELYHQPNSRFVANFFGQANFLSAHIEGDWVVGNFGRLPAVEGLRQDQKYDLMVRPDDWQLSVATDYEANGRILDGQFQGMHWLYRVELNGQEVVRILAPHELQLPPGTHVTARLVPQHSLLGFDGSSASIITRPGNGF